MSFMHFDISILDKSTVEIVSRLSYDLLLLTEVERDLWLKEKETLFSLSLSQFYPVYCFKSSPYPVPKWILLFKLGRNVLLIEIIDSDMCWRKREKLKHRDR